VIANIGSVIVSVFGASAPLPVSRTAAGDHVNGEWTPGATSAIQIKGAVMQATPNDLKQLPEGERSIESIVIFSRAPFQMSDSETQLQADVVTYRSRTWRVRSCANWSELAGFYKTICQRESI
jgi:hypothetical protein